MLLRDKLVRWSYRGDGLSGRSYFRGFNWVAERPQILRAHLDTLPPAKRPEVRALIDESIRDISRAAYEAAHKHGDPRWASRYLRRLMRTGGGARFVLPYLLAVWMPAPLLAVAGKVTRWRR